MADYRFVMMNAVLIIGFVMTLGHLGMAEVLDEDLVVGDAGKLVSEGVVNSEDEVDFDSSRLEYRIDFDEFETQATNFEGFIWDGSGTSGNLTYNVSEIDKASLISRNPGLLPLVNIDNLYILKDGVKEQVTSTSYDIDLSNVDELVIVLTDEDAEFLGFENSDLSIGDVVEVNNVSQISYNVEEGFFVTISNYVSYGFLAVIEIFSVLKAWIDFVFVIPGAVGTALRMYITAFVAYFLIKELWLG